MTGAPTLRILIITGIFPPDIGGPATYVPQIATALASLGHQVTVPTLSDQLNPDDCAYTFPVKRLPRKGFKLWRWIRTMAQIIHLGGQVDVLFVNGLALEAVMANLWCACRWSKKWSAIWRGNGRAAWAGWLSNFESFQQRRYGLKVEVLNMATQLVDKAMPPPHRPQSLPGSSKL